MKIQSVGSAKSLFIRLSGHFICEIIPAGEGVDYHRERKVTVRFDYEKERALFAYLLLEPGAHLRHHLALLLWPDRSRAAALGALRTTLYRLRKKLGDYGVDFKGDRKEVTLELADAITVDVWQLSSPPPCHEGRGVCPVCLAWLRKQVSLYRGELLLDVIISDGLGFEEWLLHTREVLRRRVLEWHFQLAEHYRLSGEAEEALSWLQRIASIDPWNAQACQEQMALLHSRQRSGEALALYASGRKQRYQRIMGLTDSLIDWFQRPSSVLGHARGLGLMAVEAVGPLRRRLASLAMGRRI